MSKYTFYTSRVSWEKLSYNKGRDKADREKQLKVVVNLAKAFDMEVREELGRLPLSRICYIVARDMKHKLKVAWHIIVYQMQTLLTGSNEPGPEFMILYPLIWTSDFDLATLDNIKYHCKWYIIVMFFLYCKFNLLITSLTSNVLTFYLTINN